METTTASDAFSALLMPGEDRPRPAMQNGRNEAGDNTGIEQFVSQLLGFEDRPLAPSKTHDFTGTVSSKIKQDTDPDNSDLSKGLTQSPAPASQTERFIGLPSQEMDPPEKTAIRGSSDTATDARDPINSGMMSGRSNPAAFSIGQSGLIDMHTPRGGDPSPVNMPGSADDSDKANHPLGDVGKIATMPIILVDKTATAEEKPVALGDRTEAQIAMDRLRTPVSGDEAAVRTYNRASIDGSNQDAGPGKQAVSAQSPAAFKPDLESAKAERPESVAQTANKSELLSVTNRLDTRPAAGDPGLADNSSAENPQKAAAAILPAMPKPLSDRDRNAPAKSHTGAGQTELTETMQGFENGERKLLNPLDLRLASASKMDGKTITQPEEFRVRDATNRLEKTIAVETKTPIADLDNIPAKASLEGLSEVAAPAAAMPVGTAQRAAKTISFDWNAPQFAERFASGLSDMKVSGDLKRFEINPRNMGRLEISLVANGAQEIIRIEAENDAAREMIVQHSQAIQDLLKAQGRPDLNLRVDIKDSMPGSSESDMMNFAQQENEGGDQERPNPSPDRDHMTAIDRPSEPHEPNDNSRYA